MELRELRLWHWREVIKHRNRAKLMRSYGQNQSKTIAEMARIADECANFHMKAVQLLNDHVSGTAEADNKETGEQEWLTKSTQPQNVLS